MAQVITPGGVATRPEMLAIYHTYLGDALPPGVPAPPAPPTRASSEDEDDATWDVDDEEHHAPHRLLDRVVDGLIPQRQARRDAELSRVRALAATSTPSDTDAAAQELASYDAAGGDISALHAQKREEIDQPCPVEALARRRVKKALKSVRAGPRCRRRSRRRLDVRRARSSSSEDFRTKLSEDFTTNCGRLHGHGTGKFSTTAAKVLFQARAKVF